MIDFGNSFCFIGNSTLAKKKVMETLSKKLNVPIVDIEKFLWLPKKDDPKISPEDKALREKYPDVPNLYDLGFKIDEYKKIKEKFSTLGAEVYQRQFTIKLAEALTEKVNGKIILGIPATLSDLTNSQEGVINQIKNDSELQGAIVNPNVAVKNAIKSVVAKFPNVICANNPSQNPKAIENSGNHAEAKYDGNLISQDATINLDTSKFFDTDGSLIQGEVADEKIDEIVNNARKNAQQSISENQEHSQTHSSQEQEKPKRKSLFSKIGRFFGKVVKKTFGFVANVATLGIYGKIRDKVLYKKYKSALNKGVVAEQNFSSTTNNVSKVSKKSVSEERDRMQDNSPNNSNESEREEDSQESSNNDEMQDGHLEDESKKKSGTGKKPNPENADEETQEMQ